MPASARHPLGLDLQHLDDLVRDLGEPALGALEPLLGAGGVLARRAHGLERGAGGAVGLGQRVLGLRQPVGGGAAGVLRALDLADQALPARREHVRRVGQLIALARGFGGAFRDGRDLRLRAGSALVPGGALGGDRLQPALGMLGLARQRLRLGAGLGQDARGGR